MPTLFRIRRGEDSAITQNWFGQEVDEERKSFPLQRFFAKSTCKDYYSTSGRLGRTCAATGKTNHPGALLDL
jgi:hypothetical protein